MNPELLARQFPILDFDPFSEAILRPNHEGLEIDFPDIWFVLFREVIEKVVREYDGKELYSIRSEVKPFPFYEIEVEGQRIAITQVGVGAPMAAMQMEIGGLPSGGRGTWSLAVDAAFWIARSPVGIFCYQLPRFVKKGLPIITCLLRRRLRSMRNRFGS